MRNRVNSDRKARGNSRFLEWRQRQISLIVIQFKSAERHSSLDSSSFVKWTSSISWPWKLPDCLDQCGDPQQSGFLQCLNEDIYNIARSQVYKIHVKWRSRRGKWYVWLCAATHPPTSTPISHTNWSKLILIQILHKFSRVRCVFERVDHGLYRFTAVLSAQL